jgi:hypothetical protein
MAEKLNCNFIVDNNLLEEVISIINKTHFREKIALVNNKLFSDVVIRTSYNAIIYIFKKFSIKIEFDDIIDLYE